MKKHYIWLENGILELFSNIKPIVFLKNMKTFLFGGAGGINTLLPWFTACLQEELISPGEK